MKVVHVCDGWALLLWPKNSFKNNTLQGMPLYLAQVNVPGWIPWPDPCQPEDVETYDVNGLDAEGRSFMKKRHGPKGEGPADVVRSP